MPKKNLRPNLFSRQIIMTLAERKDFDEAKDYYINLGYDATEADKRAWDHYWAVKLGARRVR